MGLYSHYIAIIYQLIAILTVKTPRFHRLRHPTRPPFFGLRKDDTHFQETCGNSVQKRMGIELGIKLGIELGMAITYGGYRYYIYISMGISGS